MGVSEVKDQNKNISEEDLHQQQIRKQECPTGIWTSQLDLSYWLEIAAGGSGRSARGDGSVSVPLEENRGEDLCLSSLAGTMGQMQSGAEKEVCLQDIQELYRRFASECPSGNLHLHEFKRIFGINSSSSAEESAYMEIVFDSFDTNKVRKEENS